MRRSGLRSDVLERSVRTTCSAPGAIEDAGLPSALSIDGLVSRLRSGCTGEIDSLAARTFGGPHAKTFRERGPAARTCLSEAFRQTSKLVRSAFRTQSRCVRRHQGGRTCDLEATERQIDRQRATAAKRIDRKCDDLPDLLLLDVSEYLERAKTQSRCLVPTAHGRGEPLDLDCGPRPSIPVPARATATQVVLDESEWGTRCGDGSPYAFWIRLAPEGSPPENVVVHMQGGGVYLFNDDCRNVSAGPLQGARQQHCDRRLHVQYERPRTPSATSRRSTSRIARKTSTSAAAPRPRSQTSRCTDTEPETFEPRCATCATSCGRNSTVPKTAIARTDPESSAAARRRAVSAPRSTTTICSTTSAGHARPPFPEPRSGSTTARCSGCEASTSSFPPGAPPQCSRRTARPTVLDHAVAPRAARAAARVAARAADPERVEPGRQHPGSHHLLDSLPEWIDAHRGAYCEGQGLPGVRYFLPAGPSHIHGILGSNSRFPGLSSHGVTLGEWLGDAAANPGSRGRPRRRKGILPHGTEQHRSPAPSTARAPRKPGRFHPDDAEIGFFTCAARTPRNYGPRMDCVGVARHPERADLGTGPQRPHPGALPRAASDRDLAVVLTDPE